MGYNNVIDKSLTRAFNLLKDLAEDMVFNKKNISDFDFGSGTASLTSQYVPIKAIVIATSKETATSSVKKQVMLRISEVGDLGAYDSLTYNNETWRIGSVIKSNGFISVVEVFKG
jgi:hypothetical protein